KAAKSHCQSAHNDEAGRSFFQHSDLGGLRMGEHPRRLHAKSGRDDRGDLPARRGIDGAVLSRRLSRPARRGTLRASPFGKKALQMGTAARVAAMPDVVKQSTADLVAFCPSTGEKILEIEWRTRLQRQSATMRQGIRLDPLGDCPVADPDLRGYGDEALARSVEVLGLLEHQFPRVTTPAAQHRLAVAGGRRKSGATAEATDRCHLPLDAFA